MESWNHPGLPGAKGPSGRTFPRTAGAEILRLVSASPEVMSHFGDD